MPRFHLVDILCHELAPVSSLFLDAPDSGFALVVAEALALLRTVPRLVDLVERDLDTHARNKKALRDADLASVAEQGELLPGVERGSVFQGPRNVTLGEGRKRTPAHVVALFLLLRGYLGGFKTSRCDDFLRESRTIAVFLAHHGTALPGKSTLIELTNAVALPTREA